MKNKSSTFLSWQVSGVDEKIELRWNSIEICLPVVDQAAAVSVDVNCNNIESYRSILEKSGFDKTKHLVWLELKKLKINKTLDWPVL